jgi:uncharacterized protein YecE (DUF72 family)
VLRALHEGPVALEPRHATWFTAEVDTLLRGYDVARVAADPALSPEAARPGGATSLAYFRLHGSPRIYWSRYEEAWLDALARQVADAAREASAVWCIFDNTASGSALPNALGLQARLVGATPAP